VKINETTSYYLLLLTILLSVVSVLTLNPNFMVSLSSLLFLKKPEGSRDIAEKNQFELFEEDNILIDPSTSCDEKMNPSVSVVDNEVYVGYECAQGNQKSIKSIKVGINGEILCPEFSVSEGNDNYRNPSIHATKSETGDVIFMGWEGQKADEKNTRIYYRVFNGQCQPNTKLEVVDAGLGLEKPIVGSPFSYFSKEINKANGYPINPNTISGIVWRDAQVRIGEGAIKGIPIKPDLKLGAFANLDQGLLNELVANRYRLFGSGLTDDESLDLFGRLSETAITFSKGKKSTLGQLSAYSYFTWASDSKIYFRELRFNATDFTNSLLWYLGSVLDKGILPVAEDNPCPRLKEGNAKIIKISDKMFALFWVNPYEKKAYVRLHNGTHLSKGYQIHEQDFNGEIMYDAEGLGDNNTLVTVFSGKVSGKSEIYLRFINDTMLATLKGYDPKCPPTPIDLSYLCWVIPVAAVVFVVGARGIDKCCRIPEEPEFVGMDDKVTHVSQKGARQAGSEIKEVKDEDHSEGSGNLASIVPVGSSGP